MDKSVEYLKYEFIDFKEKKLHDSVDVGKTDGSIQDRCGRGQYCYRQAKRTGNGTKSGLNQLNMMGCSKLLPGQEY
jgi:hypothetical protein